MVDGRCYCMCVEGGEELGWLSLVDRSSFLRNPPVKAKGNLRGRFLRAAPGMRSTSPSSSAASLFIIVRSFPLPSSPPFSFTARRFFLIISTSMSASPSCWTDNCNTSRTQRPLAQAEQRAIVQNREHSLLCPSEQRSYYLRYVATSRPDIVQV